MKKVIRLTESDLMRIVRRVINEENDPSNYRTTKEENVALVDFFQNFKKFLDEPNVGFWKRVNNIRGESNGFMIYKNQIPNLDTILQTFPEESFRYNHGLSYIFVKKYLENIYIPGQLKKKPVIKSRETENKFYIGVESDGLYFNIFYGENVGGGNQSIKLIDSQTLRSNVPKIMAELTKIFNFKKISPESPTNK